MYSLLGSIALLAAFASTASAHGYVTSIVADGVTYEGWQILYWYNIDNGMDYPDVIGWYAENLDIGFVPPHQYADPDIVCHKNAVHANISGTVAAGGSVEFQWTEWPHGIGPVMTYVANCGGDCADIPKTDLEWVKIDEAGIDYNTQVWASQDLIDNGNRWTTRVPSSLAPGNYVFRHEIIALHGAGSPDGAQNYPQCVNLEVTGSGNAHPAGTVGTALYGQSDPGILFNPYRTITSYDIPGPALWTG